jgi:hypothetical protein
MPLRLFSFLVIAALSFGTAGAGVVCDRVVAIGDLHGGYEDFITILQKTDLVDEQLRWKGGQSCLVQEGDIVDRGNRTRELLEFLMGLERQAPDRIRILLGNHEALNMIGDFRYVAPEDYAAFAGEESEAQREKGFRRFLRTEMAAGLDESAARAKFDSSYPPGWFAHRKAFSPMGRYGAWLLERPSAVKIDGSVFVHGGLIPDDVRGGLDLLNQQVIDEIRTYHYLRGKLEQLDWLNEFTPTGESFVIVLNRLERELAMEDVRLTEEALQLAASYVKLQLGASYREDGPLWHRDYAMGAEEEYESQLDEVLEILDADRLVIAHTNTADMRIQSRFDDRVFLVNTGSGPAYAGRPSALDIEWYGKILAIYPDGVELLADPPLSDELIEKILTEGEVIEREPLGKGITKPDIVKVKYRGLIMKGLFKTLDMFEPVVTREKTQEMELSFTDSYKYERAAYLLDRFLGMNMVPVAVNRKIKGSRGAVIHWIPGESVNEKERRDQKLLPPDPAAFSRQLELMRLFDALILNDDRHLANRRITTDDWKLHLIDHSRSFRLAKTLPEKFGEQPVMMPRGFYERLKAMDRKEMKEMLKGSVVNRQVSAMMARRDKLLERIEQDRQRWGDDLVFY